MLFTILVLQGWPQGYILSNFFKLLRVLFLSEMLVEFSEYTLNICIFTHAPVLYSKLQVNVLRICFPQDKRGGGNYDLLYQSPIRKYEDDLEHMFIYILYDLYFF